jgi:hypothetical protein
MSHRSVTRRGRRKTRMVVLAAAISLMAGAQALAPTQAAAVDDVGSSCTDSIWLIDCTAADDSDEYGTGNTDTTSSGEDPWGGWETDAGTGDEGSTDPGSTTGGSTDSSTTGGGTDAGFGGGPSGSTTGGTGLSSWDVWVKGSGGDSGEEPFDNTPVDGADPEDFPIFAPERGGMAPPPADSCYWIWRRYLSAKRVGDQNAALRDWDQCQAAAGTRTTARVDPRLRKPAARADHRRRPARNAKKGRHVGHGGRPSR